MLYIITEGSYRFVFNRQCNNPPWPRVPTSVGTTSRGGQCQACLTPVRGFLQICSGICSDLPRARVPTSAGTNASGRQRQACSFLL